MARNQKAERRQSSSSTIFEQLSGNVTALISIVVVSLVVYGQSLNFTIGKFDEDVIITFNERILKNSSNVIEVLKRDAFFNNPGRNFYRPFQNLTFFIDTQIGKGKSWAYYFTNILLHIATCWLLFQLLKDFRFRPGTALATSLIYATTPLFVHAVAWAPGRGDLLIAMFTLLCLRATFSFLDSGRISSLAVLHVCFFLSMFSKETSVLIPIIITAAWWLFYPRRSETARTLVLTLLPCLIPIALWFVTRSMVIPKYPDATVFGFLPFLNNLRAVPETIGKFFIPVGLAPLPAFSWLVTGLGSVVAIALVYGAVRSAGEDNRKLVLLGLFWFLIFSAPGVAYTNELGDIAYDYLEHRSYLPMMGFGILIAVILDRRRDVKQTQTLSWVIAGCIVFYAGFAHVRARNYKTADVFYDMAIKGNPNSGMSLLNRGYLRYVAGDLQGSIEDYTKAATVCPTYSEPLVNRGVLYQDMNRMLDAKADFLEAVRRNPKLFAAQYNMANWASKMDDYPTALKYYEKALKLRPSFAEGWSMVGAIKAKLGYLDASLPYFARALKEDPTHALTYVNRGKAFYNVGRKDEACADWNKGSTLGSAEAASLLRDLCR